MFKSTILFLLSCFTWFLYSFFMDYTTDSFRLNNTVLLRYKNVLENIWFHDSWKLADKTKLFCLFIIFYCYMLRCCYCVWISKGKLGNFHKMFISMLVLLIIWSLENIWTCSPIRKAFGNWIKTFEAWFELTLIYFDALPGFLDGL